MYTMLDDKRQANFINNYLNTHQNCTMKDIIQDCVVTRTRLKYLEAQGYFTLPEPTPRSMRNKQYYANKAIQSVTA